MATGEWIGFIDGDDFIEPDMYDVLLKNAIKHQADISHCGYQMVFPSRVDYYHNSKKMVVQNHETGLYDILSGNYVEPGLWNKLYKAFIVKNVIDQNLIDSNIKINEDLLMNYYFFKLSNTSVYYDICPYHYYQVKILYNNKKYDLVGYLDTGNKLYDPIKVQKIILDDVRNNKDLANVIYGRLAGTYINGAAMTNPDREAYIEEYIKMCRGELKEIKEPFLAGNRSKISKIRYHLCSFSPALYRTFHKVYAKARGTDNRYEVR